MASISINSCREDYPNYSDKEIAIIMAEKYKYVTILRYKSRGSDLHDNFGVCKSESEVNSYFNSPYCRDVEILYDTRIQTTNPTPDWIILGRCENCGKETTVESLTLGLGNDFYYCPNPECGRMYCTDCYSSRLPLTANPGYGMCIYCKIEVKRAIIGLFGT